jgi:hypothetical protein
VLRTDTVTVAQRTAGPAATPPARTGPGAPQTFVGSGPKTLGTITIGHAAALRWTSATGRFRLLFDGGATAVNSSGRAGELFAPSGTYRDVQVLAPGRWTVQVG